MGHWLSKLATRATVALAMFLGPALANSQAGDGTPATESPRFTRHVEAVFSRLGCNGGTCHGAVKGKNGFQLSLFSGNAELDYDQLVHSSRGRRLNVAAPEESLLLAKPSGHAPHKGGRVMPAGCPEYEIVRAWIAAGATLDDSADSHVTRLSVTPAQYTAQSKEDYQLAVEAAFADGSHQDVTALCSFNSLDKQVATVDRDGRVRAVGVGDTALIVRYRAEPVMAQVIVPAASNGAFPEVAAQNFIDREILAKLRRLNLPPAPLADDETLLRRLTLDVTGELPAPSEVRAFLADTDPQKRIRKIDELLERPGYAALWTLKFCDLLRASDFGVYADGLKLEDDAPRFQAWVRARLEENVPYDQFIERILTATSREGRSLEEWSKEVVGLHEGATKERRDVALYSGRKTLDLYWQRRAAAGVPGALQVAHAVLGLRLECAQCHRHPHDVWQQDDLLSFANFFTRVREPGFQGDNEKKFPELAVIDKQYAAEGKKLLEEAKKLKETEGKKLDEAAKVAKAESGKLKEQVRQAEKQREQLTAEAQRKRDQAGKLSDPQSPDALKLINEAAELDAKNKAAGEAIEPLSKQLAQLAEPETAYEAFRQRVADMERRGNYLPEAGKRIIHAEISHLAGRELMASVTSPLGTQSSKQLRILGHSEAIELKPEQDPRVTLMAWLREKDNPFFAKAIVNRVWAHYFGRGIIDPPDNLSPLNPATHPELLAQLCSQFIEHGYDLKWLHRTIAGSRTYQQSSEATSANRIDRTNYAYFYYRRLPAEVLLDALNQATGTSENMDMSFYRWPEKLKTVEIPTTPRNNFVTFMLENFGRPARNSAVQCDCQRDNNASVLQVLSFANHPRVRQKIADERGEVARIIREVEGDAARIDELFLTTLSRRPSSSERGACEHYLAASESPAAGLQGVMWGLLNTREFMLQH